MPENNESEKPEESDLPENQEEVTEEEITPESTDSSESDSTFEDQEGEVIPPEKKKGSGCGFFLLILLVLTGGSGYLYYTKQIPPQINEWIEPLIKPLEQQLVKVIPALKPQSQKKQVPRIEERIPTPTIHKKIIPPVKEEPIVEMVSPSLEEEKNIEHISGSLSDLTPETGKTASDHLAKVSGNTTLVEPKKEPIMEEPETETVSEEIEEEYIEEPEELESAQIEEKFAPPVPVVKAPPILYTEEPRFEEDPAKSQENEKSEAVQAYLDFVESTLAKIGELIKTGFLKTKEFLVNSLGR